MMQEKRKYNGDYTGEYLNYLAFPMGGIGAGMICLTGTGALSHVSLRHKPDLASQPCIFATLSIKGQTHTARILEGPVPKWKIFGPVNAGNGLGGTTYGLSRFSEASFRAQFPFGMVSLKDGKIPLEVEITGWSPFIPGDADNSSLPVVGLECRFCNRSASRVEAVFSFNSFNFMATGSGGESVINTENGFVLRQPPSEEKPWDQGAFCVRLDDSQTRTDCAWYRGGKFDPLTMLWKIIERGEMEEQPAFTDGPPSPGGSAFVSFRLRPGEIKNIRVLLAWYVPKSDIRAGEYPPLGGECSGGPACCEKNQSQASTETYVPWYASKFPDIQTVMDYWQSRYDELRRETCRFTDCFYDSTLPEEVLEAIAANLTILKSPTVLRQADGRLWGWEECSGTSGCCHGSCTHVWNYAQAIPHLFPDLERSLRETEFNECQNEQGHQTFRASLPIRPADHSIFAAADGQLGGIMKIYREWRISGDTNWLKNLWQKIKASMDYCIETWDPRHEGVISEPHHNTYDVEFWGPEPMCDSFYLGALQSAVVMGKALNDDVSMYESLFQKGKAYLNENLFDGEYFYQKASRQYVQSKCPAQAKIRSVAETDSPETIALWEKEVPRYQYGSGCLSDGLLGAWMAQVCGVGEILNREKIKSHLLSVYRYNFKRDLSDHSNPRRPGYAMGNEGGLLLCTWPKGDEPSLPFSYSNEVWTGIEYQAASHLMMLGYVEEGLQIVRTCRDRYDGKVRNPFDEYECGDWYARSMSSYALIQGLTGVRYDAIEKALYLEPRIKDDFRSFLSTSTGYGTVGVKSGNPFVEVKSGKIEITEIKYVRTH